MDKKKNLIIERKLRNHEEMITCCNEQDSFLSFSRKT